MGDYGRGVWSGAFAGLAALVVTVLDVPMLGRDLHWGWIVGMGLVSLVVVFAVTLLIWRNEQ